jgi:hypothetical protein
MEKITTKELMEQYNDVKDGIQTIKQMIDLNIEANYGLKPEPVLTAINKYRETDFKSLSIDELNDVFNEFVSMSLKSSESSDFETGYNALDVESIKDGEEDPRYNYIISFRDEIVKDVTTLEDMEANLKEIEEEVKKANDEYFTYINSEEYREKKQQEIEDLRTRIADLPDGPKRKELESMLETLEDCVSNDYIFNRLIDSDGIVNDAEIHSIVRSFFDHNSSKIIMNKYIRKCIKLGLHVDTYKNFFNIEENMENRSDLVNKGIYVYNNLLLSHFVRLVSYCDPNNERERLVIGEFLKFLIKISQNKFSSRDDETDAANIVNRFCGLFTAAGYYEKFRLDNRTHPLHNARLDSEQEKRNGYIDEIAELITKIKEVNGEIPEDLPNADDDFSYTTTHSLYEYLCSYKKIYDDILASKITNSVSDETADKTDSESNNEISE